MNNEEKDLKNVEVANETEKNARFGRKNKQKAEGEKTQEENEETVFYAEYRNTGEGAATASRASFGKQLNDISNYNEAQILAGDDGWNPVENGNVLLQNLKR